MDCKRLGHVCSVDSPFAADFPNKRPETEVKHRRIDSATAHRTMQPPRRSTEAIAAVKETYLPLLIPIGAQPEGLRATLDHPAAVRSSRRFESFAGQGRD